MDEETLVELGKAMVSLAEANAATMDVLIVICDWIANEDSSAAQRLKTRLEFLRDQQKFEKTFAVGDLADRLCRILSHDIDVPLRSVKKIAPPIDREQLRNILQVISGGKS